MFSKGLPHFASGVVIKGFGRGSKQLGIPTANFPESVVDSLPQELNTGVYYGWANVDGGPVYKMVMSIGWNPYYKNTKKSMETHILHTFPDDFYGSLLRVCLLGYIRPERDFQSLDDLIAAIKADIVVADEALEKSEMLQYKQDDFFHTNNVEDLCR
ncbi:riboflavin kinase [Ischnura elegans]|uniref:riboflavin kinase n=1 Tax=Ischnura elegans TaxID=197161 RepID=UPI001ED87243|nr:riboflavin kinase [Ischnura elegans]